MEDFFIATPFKKPLGAKQNYDNSRRPENDRASQKKKDDGVCINEAITAPRVRLVGDNIPQPGIYTVSAAMKLADELQLDLVEISAKADPPVCKIMDYQKYLYQQKKKAKEMKANAAKVVFPVQAEACPGVPVRRCQGKGICVLPRPFHIVFRSGRKTPAEVCGGTRRVRKGGTDAETRRQAYDYDDCPPEEEVREHIVFNNINS